MDAWVFGHGTALECLLPGDPHEAWMRILPAALVVAFGVYAHGVAVSLHAAATARRELETRLSQALAHALGDFIPICAQCKSIRENGGWVRVEEYVTEHTGSRFTHGICPRCAEAVERELRQSPAPAST